MARECHGCYWISDMSKLNIQELIIDLYEAAHELNDPFLECAAFLLEITYAKTKTDPFYLKLTSKQKEVASLIHLGYKPAEIASRLNISKESVKTHTQAIYHAYNVHSHLSFTQMFDLGDVLNKYKLNGNNPN
jgi:DNA-binding NarL/FixJ family response regulator